MNRPCMPASRVRELFEYDPYTGILKWRRGRSRTKAGSVAGTLSDCGYVQVRVDRRCYYAHRLAWAYMTGEWPEQEVDHINRITWDNRFINLRAVTACQNMQNRPVQRNNSTGYRGVHRHASGQWEARIRSSGQRKYLGTFATPEEASAAYEAAAATLHPYRIQEPTNDR